MSKPLAKWMMAKLFVHAYNDVARTARTPKDLHEVYRSGLVERPDARTVHFGVTLRSLNGGDEHDFIEDDCLYVAEEDDPVRVAAINFNISHVEAYNLLQKTAQEHGYDILRGNSHIKSLEHYTTADADQEEDQS